METEEEEKKMGEMRYNYEALINYHFNEGTLITLVP